MPRILYTVDDLITDVRNQLDENNVDSVSDDEILSALNRGNDYAFDIYARLYPEPLLRYTTLDLVSGQKEYDIPEDVFEDRILRIEIEIPSASGSTFINVQQVSYRDLCNYESPNATNAPLYFCVYGRKIRFVAPTSGLYNARMWSLRVPEKLVKPQGRVTFLNTTSNYVIVDSVGADLTTESDQLESYVNIIDGQTGEIRASRQIQLIGSDSKVTFRTTPTRATVLNRTIGGTIDVTPAIVAQDDYLAPIDGTCVPYFSRPTCNFLIEYAVNEITRKLGGDVIPEERMLERLERQVERTFAGRQQTLRVSKKSRVWGLPFKRIYYE